MLKRIALIAALSVSLVSVVSAADFEAKIVNLDGSSIVDDKGKPVELTVASVCVNALMQPYQDETNLSGEEKVKRMLLAQRIQRKETTGLTAEDIALLKKLVNKAYPSPLVVSQTWEALERK